MIKAKELVDKSVEELEAVYRETCQEHFELLNKYKLTKKLDQPDQLKKKRRMKARLLTIIRQKKSAAQET